MFCLIAGKVLSSSLTQFKYILPTSETKVYLISTSGFIFSGIFLTYRKKKYLDKMLDRKYTPIYEMYLNKINMIDNKI